MILAAVGSLFSCTKRDFTVETGNTPVQFTESTMTVDLTQEYNYIPVEMLEQALVSSYTTFEFVGGSYTTYATEESESQTFELKNGSDIIFTAMELYVGAFDPEADVDPVTGTNVDTLGNPVLPSNNIEFRLPNYNNYQSVTVNLKLTGAYLGQNTTVEWTGVGRERPVGGIDIVGNWSFDGTYKFAIAAGEEEDHYTITDPFFGDTWAAVLENDLTLTLSATMGATFNVGDPHGDVTATFCAYHEQDGNMYLWPDEPCVFECTSESIMTVNGVFIGFESPADGGWYSWQGSAIDPESVATRK